MTNKIRRTIASRYGKRPQERYDDEDFRGIRAYFDYRRAREPQVFALDETTWYDLSMDEVFERISNTGSACGEQLLYYQLRCPAMNEEEYRRRAELIRLVEEDPALRQKLQELLFRLGKSNAARTEEVFSPARQGKGRLFLALLLFFGLLISGFSLLLTRATLPLSLFVLLLCANPLYHVFMTKHLDTHLPSARYSAALAAVYTRIRALENSALTAWLAPYEEAGRRARGLGRLGALSMTIDNDILQMLNGLFLWDLILYERMKIRLGRLQGEVFALHECIGRIDAAIAAASYRRSVERYCDPEIRFEAEASPEIQVVDLHHPLLRRSVPNTLDLQGSMLLTGSNASGKSTLIKAASLSVIMAQGICTALCRSYTAASFHVYTSMALSDDILAEESYFITELKAFRRILQAAQRGERIFCAIDEVLRGTNTVERIAASSVLLEDLGGRQLICLAASHDLELCSLLAGRFAMAHFEEAVVDGRVEFDYRLRPGAACTRNAIRLLSVMGFDAGLVHQVEDRASYYLEEGCWPLP